MKLMEYKAKELFDKYAVPTMNGCVVDEVEGISEKIERANLNYPVMVKCQIPIGGRGKAGGIIAAGDADEALKAASKLLHSRIRDYDVDRLLIVEKANIEKELYLSIMLDRLSKRPLAVFSSKGGVEIEKTAADDPESILKVEIDPMIGMKDYAANYLVSKSGLDMSLAKPLNALMQKLYRLFMEYDCLLCEINPLIIDKSGALTALDGKIVIDDSAVYRLPDIQAYQESVQEEGLIKEARSFNFLYIPVEAGGTVAVCSNGSGMLMSCIDMISNNGMKVAAALDLGGGATKERIAEAMRILFSTPGVDTVLINIFGGITRCDEVAGGVGLAMQKHDLDGKLIILRMEGTNKDAGIEIITGINSDSVVMADGLRESIAALVERSARK